jgi:hypothetical protein
VTAAQETMCPAADNVGEASNDLKGLTSVGDILTDYVAGVVNQYWQDLRPEEPVNLWGKKIKNDTLSIHFCIYYVTILFVIE